MAEILEQIPKVSRSTNGMEKRTHCKNGHEFTSLNTKIIYRGKSKIRSCKRCAVEASIRTRDKNPERNKEKQRWSRYRITPDEYNLLLKLQNGKCAICGKSEDLAIDHCHNSKKVRGILCRPCNSLLGLAKDDPDLLGKAIDYLERI